MKQHIYLSSLTKAAPMAFIFIICAICLFYIPAHANNWEAPVYRAILPQRVVAVDKSKQLFHFFDENTPEALKYTFICTTGQIPGAKQIINDLKTPEGVYFVQYKISEGLDFAEYGGIAYTLNYPNPVDKLRGKTGYGIWIHSKGLGIKPNDTKGCIAIGLEELTKIGPKLSYGTAVLLAETVKINESPRPDLTVATKLISQMEEWTSAWASRSNTMFNMYDSAAYSKAMPQTFKAFKANKVKLFGILPWINIFNRKIYVLEGPGYWVTWSEQFYRAPNLSTEGIRRLYWQLDDKGEYKIVGMEWIPRNLGMKADYLKGKLVASTAASDSIIAANDKTETDIKSSEEPTYPQIDMPEKGEQLPTDNIDNILADDQIKQLLQAQMSTWFSEWENKSDKFFAYYDQANFGKISKANNASQHTNFIQLKKYMQQHFKAEWIDITARPIVVGTANNLLYTESELFIRSHKQDATQGTLRLYWNKVKNGKYLIVDSSWQEKNLGMAVDYIKKVAPQIDSLISNWEEAWLNADVDKYASFYDDNARQQKIKGKANIVKQKNILWQKSKPKEIKLTGLRILLDPAGLIVDMTQHYKDSRGYTDVGTKILLLKPTPNNYLILNEKWVPLN